MEDNFMKRVYSARSKIVELDSKEQAVLDQIYSAMLNAESLISEAEDYFFGNRDVWSELVRTYDRLENALKPLAKYCEEKYH